MTPICFQLSVHFVDWPCRRLAAIQVMVVWSGRRHPVLQSTVGFIWAGVLQLLRYPFPAVLYQRPFSYQPEPPGPGFSATLQRTQYLQLLPFLMENIRILNPFFLLLPCLCSLYQSPVSHYSMLSTTFYL